MFKVKQWKRKTKILACIGLLLVGISIPLGIKIVKDQEAKQKEERRLEKLYQHGFRLLEEQIATYIKDHYSGVSKIEFSPIFMSGGGSQSFLSLDVVPVIHDNHGNKAYLGKSINKQGYGSYGTSDGLVLDIDNDDNDVIELEDFDTGTTTDVSGYTSLPEEAKLSSSTRTDKNINALVQDKQLEGVQKNTVGSPKANIKYNLEVKRGEYWEWP